MKRLKRGVLVLCLTGVVLAFGCESQPERVSQVSKSTQPLTGPGSGTGGGTGAGKGARAQPSRSPSAFRPLSPGVLGGDKVIGYRHTRSQSRLPVGDIEAPSANETANGVKRYLNNQSTFVEWPNGFSAGSPHAKSPLRQSEPYSVDRYAHEARVLQYFKDGGIPATQLGPIDVTTTVLETGTDVGGTLTRKFVGFTTILRRIVDGVEVADSYAWARFNKADEVVAERVWWPELPASVKTDLAAFRAAIAVNQLRPKLPADVASRSGKLVIHHAPPLGETWYQRVTWEVAKADGEYAVRTFDIDGKELHLVAWSSPPGDPK